MSSTERAIGAEFVEGPAEGHGTGTRDASERRAETSDAAAHGRADDAAVGLTANGEGHESCGGCRAGACAGAAGAFFKKPWVHGLPAEPNIVESEGAEGELGNKNGTGVVEALGDGGVSGGNTVAKWFSPVGGGYVGGIEEIFSPPWDAVEWAAVVAIGYLGVSGFRLRQSVVGGEGDDAVELRIELLDTIQINLGKALACQFAGFDPPREFGHG